MNYRKGGADVQTTYFKWRRETPHGVPFTFEENKIELS